MKLTKLKLKNFRCYKNEIELDINDLTCLIGKNDHGKSTILEALNAFFNDTIDKGDLSIESQGDIEITCTFSNIPDEIILDTSVTTSPKEECILNRDGNLEIKKIYKVGTTISKSAYLLAYHPSDDRVTNLLSLKNSPLKSLASNLGVDLTNVLKTKNPPLRKAIRDFINSPKSIQAIKVDGNLDTENNLKTIWTSLKALLPIYSLFKVDKSIDDKDKDVQDPMKVAVKESLAIPEIQAMLVQIENAVRVRSTEVAEKTLEKLKDIDPKLAEKMKSEFSKMPSWDKIFDLTLLNEKDIPLNKRGSGVKRLVLLSFFQAQAEKKMLEDNSPSIIYAIEEPETSQHPDHQKILIQSLIDLSDRDNIQVLFTTHSSNLAREIPIESLIYVLREEDVSVLEYGYNKTAGLINEITLEKIINSLGVLPNPKDKVEVLLFVEGVHDVTALSKYSKIFNDFDSEYVLVENNPSIGIVISGGSSLKFYVDNKYLDGLGKPQIHIYDNDIESYRDIIRRVNEEGGGKIGFNTSKLMMENYLHKNAIEEAYADNGLVFVMG